MNVSKNSIAQFLNFGTEHSHITVDNHVTGGQWPKPEGATLSYRVSQSWPKHPVYFCFLKSFGMWFAGNEQSRILIRYQYFFCNSKTRWQLSLYSEIHQNMRIYHSKYDTFVSIKILSISFKIFISVRWNVILINIDVKIIFLNQ